MNQNLDKYLDSKLKSSELTKTSPDFTRLLMEKVHTDYAIDADLRKTDRAANMIMGFVASLIGIIFIASGYIYFSSTPQTSSRVLGITGSYLENFSSFVSNLSAAISTYVPSSPRNIGLIMTLLVLSSLYLLADRFILGHRSRK